MEFKREVVTLASRPGASDTQVVRNLGVSPYSVGRWKKQYGHSPAASAPGVSVAELEHRIRTLERENADLREQRAILSLNRSTGFLQSASFSQPDLPSLYLLDVCCDPHRRQRLPLTLGKFRQRLGSRQRLVGIDLVERQRLPCPHSRCHGPNGTYLFEVLPQPGGPWRGAR